MAGPRRIVTWKWEHLNGWQHNTGPTDQGHSSKPCTSSGNGRGEIGSRVPFWVSLWRDPAFRYKAKPPSPKPTYCPAFLPALPSRTFSFVPTLPPLGGSMIHKAEASLAAGRAGMVTIILPLHVAGYWLRPYVVWLTISPLGALTVRIWKVQENTSKTEGWVPLMPSITGHLKHVFLSQPAKESLQLNTDKRSNTARETPISQWRSSWRRARWRRGGVFRVPAPTPQTLATPVPHSSLGFEVRRWDYRLKWEYARTAKQNTTGLASASSVSPHPRRNTLIVTSIYEKSVQETILCSGSNPIHTAAACVGDFSNQWLWEQMAFSVS